MTTILRAAQINEIQDGFIKVQNPDVTGNAKSYLTAAVAAAGTTLNIINSAGFAANDYCLLGKPGDEKTEIVKLATVPGNTSVTCGAAKFAHPADTPLTLLGVNQIKIYSATAKDGTYSLVATVDITPDEATTDYADTAWSATKYYKVCYYNSTTTTESQYSSQVAGTGYAFYSRKKIADRILALCRDGDSQSFPRDDVNDWINEIVEFFCNVVLSIDEEFFLTDTGALTAAAETVDLPSGFKNLKRLWVAYDGTNYYETNRVRMQDDKPDSVYNAAEPVYIFNGDQIKLGPWQAGTKYQMVYMANPTILTSDSDELPTILRSYTRAFVDYGLYRSSVAEGKAPKGAPLPPSVTEAEKDIKVQVSSRKSDYPDTIGGDEPSMVDMVEEY